MSLLIDTFNMHDALVEFGQTHPVMGTCAGLIMMSKHVPDSRIKPLGLLDVDVERNAYGRQIESSTEMVNYSFDGTTILELSTTLIRAPKIFRLGENIRILGKFDDNPVAVLSGQYLGISFHPELDGIDVFHQILFDAKSEYYFKKLNQINAA